MAALKLRCSGHGICLRLFAFLVKRRAYRGGVFPHTPGGTILEYVSIDGMLVTFIQLS